MNGPVTSGKEPLGVAHIALSQKIYEELRERIIDGTLAPGTRLRESELASELHVSRIPLREAMPQLEIEGFIKSIPRRGAFVAQLTLRDVRDLFDVRVAFEVLVARLAARRAREGAPVDGVREGMARAEVASRGGDAREIASANVALHDELTKLTGNELLITFMSSVSGRLRWLFRLTAQRDPHDLWEEHHRLVSAVLAGDEDLAAEIALAHVEVGREPSLTSLQEKLTE